MFEEDSSCFFIKGRRPGVRAGEAARGCGQKKGLRQTRQALAAKVGPGPERRTCRCGPKEGEPWRNLRSRKREGTRPATNIIKRRHPGDGPGSGAGSVPMPGRTDPARHFRIARTVRVYEQA